MNILVTGATGFIGSNLVKKLLELQFQVYVLLRQNSSLGKKRLSNLKNLKFINIEIEQLSKQNKDLPQFDICYHLASYGVDYRQQDLNLMVTGNINYTLKLIEFCALNNTRFFINTGSCFEYGITNKDLIDEDTSLNPESIYAATKVSTHYMAEVYAKQNALPLIHVRPFGVYGYNEGLHRIVPQVMRAGIQNKKLQLTYGEQTRDYLFIEDLVQAYIDLSFSQTIKCYDTYNICTGNEISIKNLILTICKVCQFDIELFEFGKIPYRNNESMRFVGNNSKIVSQTNWKPQVKLEQGILKCYKWYLDNL